MNQTDLVHLRSAIRLASAAVNAGELPYASVLVDADGAVLGQDHNTVCSSGDPTAHPELKLARWAAVNRSREDCARLTLYTSCEPCVMCTNVIARAGLGRVVFALSTEQLHALQPAELARPDSATVRTDGPALLDEAAEPVRDFYRA